MGHPSHPGHGNQETGENRPHHDHDHHQENRSNNFPPVVSPSTHISTPPSSTSPSSTPMQISSLDLLTPQRIIDTIDSPSPSQYQSINSPSPSQYQSINGLSPTTMASPASTGRRSNQNTLRGGSGRNTGNNHTSNISHNNNSHNRAARDLPHQQVSSTSSAVTASPSASAPASATSASPGKLNKPPRTRLMIAEFELKRKNEEAWLDVVLRQRNVLLVTNTPYQCILLTHILSTQQHINASF